jgi:hypothetical protein
MLPRLFLEKDKVPIALSGKGQQGIATMGIVGKDYRARRQPALDEPIFRQFVCSRVVAVVDKEIDPCIQGAQRLQGISKQDLRKVGVSTRQEKARFGVDIGSIIAPRKAFGAVPRKSGT